MWGTHSPGARLEPPHLPVPACARPWGRSPRRPASRSRHPRRSAPRCHLGGKRGLAPPVSLPGRAPGTRPRSLATSGPWGWDRFHLSPCRVSQLEGTPFTFLDLVAQQVDLIPAPHRAGRLIHPRDLQVGSPGGLCRAKRRGVRLTTSSPPILPCPLPTALGVPGAGLAKTGPFTPRHRAMMRAKPPGDGWQSRIHQPNTAPTQPTPPTPRQQELALHSLLSWMGSEMTGCRASVKFPLLSRR